MRCHPSAATSPHPRAQTPLGLPTASEGTLAIAVTPQPKLCAHRRAQCVAPWLARHASALELPLGACKRRRLRRPRCRWCAAGSCPARSQNITRFSGKSRESPPDSQAIAFLFGSQRPFLSQLPSSLRRAASGMPPLRNGGVGGLLALPPPLSRGCRIPRPRWGARCKDRAPRLWCGSSRLRQEEEINNRRSRLPRRVPPPRGARDGAGDRRRGLHKSLSAFSVPETNYKESIKIVFSGGCVLCLSLPPVSCWLG